MKKNLLVVVVVVLALGALSAGVVYAQGGTPPTNSYGWMMGGRGGYGPVHTYVVEAFADKLSLSVDTVNTRLQAGESLYDIALSQGTDAVDVPALLSEIHKSAFDAAVKAGVITQAQADFMLQRMTQNGYGYGACPMNGATTGGRGMMGGGYGYGRGMMGGWGGQYQNQVP
jgi:hypothetical protein